MSPTDEFDGEITASGPLGARLAIGISTRAQPESNGPTMPITAGCAAYAFALAAHFAGSELPEVAVEESHDW